MTQTLELPQLSGGRARVAALVESAKLAANLRGAKVVVDCRQLRAGTESFADELVRTVLVDRQAEHLQIINVSGDFIGYLDAAGKTHGVSDRMTITSAT